MKIAKEESDKDGLLIARRKGGLGYADVSILR